MKLSTNNMLKQIKGNIGQEYLPIILPKTKKMLIKCLKKNKPVNILEIGTGIGYSACAILATLPHCQLTCVEIDEMRISRAIYNFKKYGFFDRVNVINGDAKQALFSLDDKFDFIFLDSEESFYIDYVEDIKRLLKNGGLVFADNIAVKYLYDGGEIYLQDNKDKKVRKYLEAVKEYPFETKVYRVEDGIAISKKIGADDIEVEAAPVLTKQRRVQKMLGHKNMKLIEEKEIKKETSKKPTKPATKTKTKKK